MYPNIDIFSFRIPSYSLLIFIGVLFLVLTYITSLHKIGMEQAKVDRMIFVTLVAGVFTYLGASFFDTLWHCIGDAMVDGKFQASLFELNFNKGGITFEGGIITGFLVYVILVPLAFPKERRNTLIYADQIMPGILIAHSFGRIGCFLAGCCYGKETDSIFGMMYPTQEGWMKVYPTQLYEALFLLVCFFIFYFWIKKNKTEKYFITYGVFRFFLEYLRGDNRGEFIIPFLSPSQFMSIVMVIIGVVCIIVRKKLTKKEALANETPVTIAYFDDSYKNLFKGLFTNEKCPECGKRLNIRFMGKNEIDGTYLKNKEHLIHYCKKCNYIKEIDNKKSSD